MAKLNLFLAILLLSSVLFSVQDVKWVNSPPSIDSKTLSGEYYNLTNIQSAAYSYAYNLDNFYFHISSAKVIKGEKTDSIQIILNKDLILKFHQNGTLTQSKNNSKTNYSFSTFYAPSALEQSLWAAEIQIPFKDLSLDKNCEDEIAYSIQILDSKNKLLESEEGLFTSSSCWATPQTLQISLHNDTPKNQSDSPAALSRHYLISVLELSPPGYPYDSEGAKIESITLKLDTNAKPGDIFAMAFVGPDGLSLGSSNFDENYTLTLYPDDAYISDEPRTLAIEFQVSPEAQYKDQNGIISPAYYGVEIINFNFRGKYTKAPLNYQIEGSLKSNYINLMQCTRSPECGTGEICSEEFVCVKSGAIPNQNTTQNQTPPKNDSTLPTQAPKSGNSLLIIAGLAIILIIVAVYFLVIKTKINPKEDSKEKSEEEKAQEEK